VGETLYLCTPHNIIIAVDATTGKEKWRYDIKMKAERVLLTNCRGVSYAEPAEAAGTACPKRIYMATLDARLVSVNAETGAPCADFGTNGEVSLMPNMGDRPDDYYFSILPNNTSPPTVIKGNVILGGQVIDNYSTDVASGVIRSFDAVTGKLRWAWTWACPIASARRRRRDLYAGHAQCLDGVLADEELGLVYVPTGNPAPDFFGGKRGVR